MTLESGKKCGETFGYARVSTGDQNLAGQIDNLTKHGIAKHRIFTDHASGAKATRPGLEACVATLEPGDTLVVWRLDRLGRSLPHLVTLVEELRSRGIGFRSLSEGVIDTTSASGQLVFSMFAALAEFERRLIQERTKAGLLAARARGKMGGRPKIPSGDPKVRMAKALHRDPTMPIEDICKSLKISRSTLYRYLRL